MKKKAILIVALMMIAVLLVSCGRKEGFTASDLEGRWTVSDDSTMGEGVMAAFLQNARSNVGSTVIFQGGKITVEWEAEDGVKTSELGGYEVNNNKAFINGAMVVPKLEDRKLTLTEGKTVVILERR